MAFQPVTDAFQILVNYRQAGQQLQNQFYCNVNSSPPTNLHEAIGATFEAWLRDQWSTVASDQAEVNNIVVTDVRTAGGVQLTIVPATPLTGDVSGEAMPTGTTITASWRTGLAGRSFRGRTYHVGLAESQCTGNSIASGIRTQMLTAYGRLILDTQAGDYPLAVCSRVSNGAPRVSGILTNVSAVIVEEFIDSQRRRLTGRGR